MKVVALGFTDPYRRVLREALEPACLSFSELDSVDRVLPVANLLDVLIVDMDNDTIEISSVCATARDASYVCVVGLGDEVPPARATLGLGSGLDLFLCKGCDRREVVARLRAVCRTVDVVERRRISCGSLLIDHDQRTASLRGKLLTLTATEFSLLAILSASADRTVARGKLIASALKNSRGVADRTLTTHIYALRKKLGRYDAIATVRGYGFKLVSLELMR